ncbi:MAG: electron transport complex subunit RsxC [Bacteroidetes bacterium 4484_276]|nr:MAG: electron transport complex subunit RsxC [Bacteroidetes bacterium 4484_276]
MLKTFKLGGVHPPENKFSSGAAIEGLPLPKRVFIPLSQHLGSPATVLVKRGDEVKTGQLIAKSSGFISANIHSSVTGKVFKVDDVMDQSGYRRKAVIIDTREDEWEEGIDTSNGIRHEVGLSKEDIIRRMSDRGIVGLGGATFPTHVKMMVPEGKTAEYLIINGVECEPYLTSDHRLMLEKGEEMLIGTTILMKALGVEQAMIGIENNKPDAIEHLTKLAGGFKGITIHPLKVKYPQGGEKQLIKALTGREVPSGKLPIETGCVVDNVGTAFAVYEAVQKNKPLIERVVTVTGKAAKKPSNLMVRVGTPISALIENAGGLPENLGKVVGGGPMMGKALMSVEAPIVKGSSGILLMPAEEAHRADVKTCIRCGRCIKVCPMGLEPYILAQEVLHEMWDNVEADKVMDCIECGSCHYTCPSGRPLLDYIRLGKFKVGQIIRSRGKK